MAKKYDIHHASVESWIAEDPTGDFVHYLDYEKLVKGLREILWESEDNSRVEVLAVEALRSVGEEI